MNPVRVENGLLDIDRIRKICEIRSEREATSADEFVSRAPSATSYSAALQLLLCKTA